MPTNVKLIFRHAGRRTEVKLRTDVAVLGRAHGNAVRIPSADVSRRHCRLLVNDGVVTVEDMESVNGTFLNGRRLKSPQAVHPGDEIEIGPVKFTVEYELTPEARRNLRGGRDADEVQEAPVDVLEALADGEALDADELPELEIIGDALGGELPEVEPGDVQPVRPKSDGLAPIAPDFDFEATPWKMPDGGDLRDLLAQMEDEQPTNTHKSKKRRE